MKSILHTPVAAAGLLVVLSLQGEPAAAALVQLNAAAPLQVDATLAVTRYRVSNTNWDQIVATGPSISGATIVQQRDLGDANTLNSRAWDFAVSYVAGSGYTYTLTDTTLPPLGTSPSTVSWTAPFGSPSLSPTRSFNAIQLYATAASGVAGATSTAIDIRNLAFNGAGLGTAGALVALGDTDLTSPSGVNQWLVADVDLSLYNWVLSGQVQAGFVGSIAAANQADERLKFDISTQSVSAVPVPAALPLLLSGLGVMGFLSRRRAVGERGRWTRLRG